MLFRSRRASLTALRYRSFFNSSITVVGLIFSTRAVSRMPLPLTAISTICCLTSGKYPRVSIVSNERTAAAFRVATLITLFALLRTTVLDHVVACTGGTKNRFQNHGISLGVNGCLYSLISTGLEHYQYTWIDVGSSYLPSDINAAVLWAQLESCDRITQRRLEIWHQYHRAFTDLETQNKLRRPIVPQHCQHNAHMYYLLLPNVTVRTAFIEALKQQGINTVFHYVPLHSSPAGKKYGRSAGDLVHTETLSQCLVRLPLWFGMTDNDANQVIQAVINYLRS